MRINGTKSEEQLKHMESTSPVKNWRTGSIYQDKNVILSLNQITLLLLISNSLPQELLLVGSAGTIK